MTDLELIEQIKNGNANSFRFLVNKYQKLVWVMVWRMVPRQQDAEDLCQEVFLRVFKSIRHFRGDSKLSTWIGSVTYNTCIDFIRKKGSEKVVLADNNPEMTDVILKMPEAANPFDLLQKDEVKNMVQELIAQLPVHYRTVITLFYLGEFSLKEIEEITSMQEGTIKSYLNRGRNIIREAFNSYMLKNPCEDLNF